MIPQNPMFILKKDGKYINSCTGCKGTGPATIFKDVGRIESFCHFYGEGFELIEVELVEKQPVTIQQAKELAKKKKIK